MTKRVFIGISLSQEVIESCINIQAKLSDLPILFISPENIHFTLLLPWGMTNQSSIEVKVRSTLWYV